MKATGIPFEIKNVSPDKFRKEYRTSLLSVNKLKSGDKMAGRHGNKGVVSKIPRHLSWLMGVQSNLY